MKRREIKIIAHMHHEIATKIIHLHKKIYE